MPDEHAIGRLKEALRRLPGVGPRTAQRIAFHMLERDREGARLLAEALMDAAGRVTHCARCNNFSEAELAVFVHRASETRIYCVWLKRLLTWIPSSRRVLTTVCTWC